VNLCKSNFTLQFENNESIWSF